MFKDYLLEVVDKNSVLHEGISFSKYVKLREKVEKMTEDEAFRFLSEIRPITKTAMSVAGATIGFGPIHYIIYRAIRAGIDKCSGACGTFAINTPKRQICMAKCKVVALTSQLGNAKKSISKCKGDKSCIGSVNKLVSDLEWKISKAKEKYASYQKHAIKTGRNPNPYVEPEDSSPLKIPG